MGNKNTNLYLARNNKDDEFYTTFSCIEKELSHYENHFYDKVVLCNCDDPFESNFAKYFLKNFLKLNLKKLICTTYASSKVSNKECHINKDGRHGFSFEISRENFEGQDINFIKKKIRKLKGDGDFRSTECIEYLKQSDIVVTNPPFSLFKEMLSLLISFNKKFLLIGNQNALLYKEIFPLIKNNVVWTGYQFGEMKFRVPDDSIPRSTRYWVDENGQKWRSLGNAMWLTNLDIDLRHKLLPMNKKYSKEEYPKYDNYDAINVKRIIDIPGDYPGIMGVPITVINRYNSDQIEIIGEANHGSDNQYDLFAPVLNGKKVYKRILIRNKMLNEED